MFSGKENGWQQEQGEVKEGVFGSGGCAWVLSSVRGPVWGEERGDGEAGPREGQRRIEVCF